MIKSTNTPDEDEELERPEKIKRSGSKNVLRKKVSETYLRDESSEEFLPVQTPGNDWSVRKTTEVRTSEEVRRTESRRTRPGR